MGKTVTTYLIDGDPKGTQYAFISNKICQMFVLGRPSNGWMDWKDNDGNTLDSVYRKQLE